jgi:signal transduction histidine kinase
MLFGIICSNNEGTDLKKATDYREHKSNVLPEQESVRKAFILTAGVGGSFGLLTMVIISSMYGFPAPILPYIIGIPLYCASIAGIAGISSIYISRFLLRIGIINLVTRQIIGVILVISIAMTLSLSVGVYFGFINFKDKLPIFATTAIIGFVIGLIVTLVDRRLWKMRQQVLTLEIENNYLAELTEKDQQMQKITKNLIITEERNRMARELHDSISQGIHGIIYTVHSLRQHLQTEDAKAKEILDHLEITADTTLNELRAMILELKPSLLEERGLAEALKLHCELFAKRLKIKCDLSLEKIDGMTPQQEMTVYRIVQEALANIQQYARADQVLIVLSSEGNQLKLKIQDNGEGFILEKVKRGNGLDNMEARCRENAGLLKIESKPGQGTTIEATFSIKLKSI